MIKKQQQPTGKFQSPPLRIWGGPRRRRCSDYVIEIIQKLLVLAAFLFFLSYVQMATAASGIEMERVNEGTLFYRAAHDNQYRSAPMLNTDIEMRVTGFINRTRLSQTFHNGSDDWVEGVYVFPLPENAAVDHMRIRVGERIIEGQIKERSEAKKTYEQAKAQGKRASLLEQERPNMFTTSVANIGPREKVIVEIELQQTLRYDQGVFRLRFPLAITPRYIPGNPVDTANRSINSFSPASDQVADADRITPIVAANKKVNPVSLRVELDAGFPLNRIDSSYHAIDSQSHGDGRYTVSLQTGEIPSDRDFELVWEPELGHAPRAALFRERVADENYYLVMMLPPAQHAEQKQALPREVVYVIDTSGSMGGVSIRQARKALLMALQRLRPDDYFNVIEFNSVTNRVFDKPQPATVLNVARARNYVAGLTARGGTEMMSAMREALVRHEDTQRLRQVIFLTDGAIGNEEALFEYIRHKLGNTRLFTVGIGSAPNSHFMSKAAQFGRGTFTYIGDVNEVAEKMQILFSKLDTPVMRDLRIMQQLGEFEMWPRTLPDLYAGEPLMFTARSDMSDGEIQLLGSGQSDEWQVSFYLQDGNVGSGIGKLWARSKIDALLDSLHDGAEQDLIRDEVIRIALTHHLVSRYTSLVAVDVTPVRPQDEMLKSKAVPASLPHGQDAKKIFGMQTQTGTAQYQLLLTGLLLLLCAFMVWVGLGMYRQRGGSYALVN